MKLFFFFLRVLFSLLSGRAMMLRTTQLCVGSDLFPVMFSSFGMYEWLDVPLHLIAVGGSTKRFFPG
jgi:hypothetical protein